MSERVKKIIDAGVDQLGGEALPELVVQLVKDGRISESRIDQSVRRLLRQKFELGLFDNPFVDVDNAVAIVGQDTFRKEGEDAQRRAYTLLTNRQKILPLSSSKSVKVYVENVDPARLEALGHTVVANCKDADIALLRLKTYYEKRPGGFEAMLHDGSLEYPRAEKERQMAIFTAVPTVVDIYLERPAVIPEIAENAAALLASYGSSDDAFLDVVFGRAEPEGKLPFDLPRSMEAVENSRSDVPFDTKEPVFKFGHGLRYD
jgi:hypothetical protein